MIECKKCGMCCECIVLNVNKNYIKYQNGPEWKFAYRNFVEISKEKAYKINPYLKKWNKKQEKQYFYICKQFCSLTKTCLVHSIRPTTCSGFPWYGRKPRKQSLYSLDCIFQKDLKSGKQ